VAPAQAEQPAAATAYMKAWLACVDGKLYFRSESTLGTFLIAVLSTTTLKVEKVIDLTLPIPAFLKAKAKFDIIESKTDDGAIECKVSLINKH
jgi:hypothetical protein